MTGASMWKLLTLSALLAAGCSDSEQAATGDTGGTMNGTAGGADAAESAIAAPAGNPFFTESPLYFNYPPFDQIQDEHYLPAFERGMEEQLEEVDLIVAQPEEPTFENTLVPLERSGRLLNRVATVFFAMTSADTNDRLQEIEAEIAPRLSAHSDAILLNGALFERVQAIYGQRDGLGLDDESLRLVEETWKDFVRAGARLSESEKERLRAINTELAELETTFSQNVLNEVNAMAIVVNDREELAGMREAEIEAAAAAARERETEGYVLPLLNTSQQPALTVLENRPLRERILQTSLSRNSRGGEYDNREVLSRTARLRAERARLLGFDHHAEYVLENQTAGTVEAAMELLDQLIPAAVRNVRSEQEDLQALIEAEGGNFPLRAWDWNYYAEKLKQQRYAFDETQLKPYFELNSVLRNGVFYAAGQIYGLRFEERQDLPVYHEDVRVFEVFEEDGTTLGLFLFDPFARPSKRGGAWMNDYVPQSHLLNTRPIVGNHLNITEPAEGEPALLTFDEVITAFHEFGHALHGLFSNVNYPSFSGTNVPRDFVEYPSQVNEMWATWPEVLRNYARHYETGEPMPQELIDRVLEAQKFNQGYFTAEYLGASMIDLALHRLAPDEVPAAENLMAFEAQALEEAGLALEAVPPRYRLPYFSHIMGGYSAGYYSYIWSEVLDADTVEWFKESGGMLRANGQHFRDTLLSRGGAVEALDLFRAFRGREPVVEPLLERRGLN